VRTHSLEKKTAVWIENLEVPVLAALSTVGVDQQGGLLTDQTLHRVYSRTQRSSGDLGGRDHRLLHGHCQRHGTDKYPGRWAPALAGEEVARGLDVP
jgi:hypothetical protein